MKKNTFIIIGMLLTTLVIGITSCNSPRDRGHELSARARQSVVAFDDATSPIITENLGRIGRSVVYSLKKDGVEYIVLLEAKGATAIIKHEPKRQAEVNKQCLEPQNNPEIRPVPVGSEEAFIEYNN
jgi:hypothetical protein